jgi:hypothetical protein
VHAMVTMHREPIRVNRLKLFALAALAVIVAMSAFTGLGKPSPEGKAPRFLANNEIALPENYREWVFVSSGIGMSYGPENAQSGNPPFSNVFVKPEAYRSFMKTGTWPNGTMFVMEVRRSKTNESINKTGNFQADLLAIEAEVKDESRFPAKWGFYKFANGATTGTLMAAETTECQSCHSQHGAVDNTFVQFYPTLFDVAKKKGTVKDQY